MARQATAEWGGNCAPTGQDPLRSVGSKWAAASARTLARRLRRKWRLEVGLSRAQALDRRVNALRSGVLAHWQLSDELGCHFAQLSDAIEARALLR